MDSLLHRLEKHCDKGGGARRLGRGTGWRGRGAAALIPADRPGPSPTAARGPAQRVPAGPGRGAGAGCGRGAGGEVQRRSLGGDKKNGVQVAECRGEVREGSKGRVWGLGGAVQMVGCRERGKRSAKDTDRGRVREAGWPRRGGNTILREGHTSGLCEPSPKLIKTNGGPGFKGTGVWRSPRDPLITGLGHRGQPPTDFCPRATSGCLGSYAQALSRSELGRGGLNVM